MYFQQLFISMPGGGEFLILLVLAGAIYWIKCIAEIATAKFTDDTTKIVWLLIVILTGFIGALIYTVAGRQNKIDS